MAIGATSALATEPYIESAYYEGDVYQFIIPSATSSNPNQFTIGCFTLGPDHNDQAGATNTFYALFVPGASQESCPDGSFTHDHVLTAVPGDPGYSPFWSVHLLVPGANWAAAQMPIDSEAEVLYALENDILAYMGAPGEPSFVFQGSVLP